jgi:Transposase DDE domain group 1
MCAAAGQRAHSVDGWRAVLEPVVARYRDTVKRLYFRGDAAFANPERASTTRSGYQPTPSCRTGSAICSSARSGNRRTRLRRRYASFPYQAQNWNKPRRVVAKVEWQLYPRVGFIVTNLAWPPKRIVAFYSQRGTAEQWIKEGKGAIKWTHAARSPPTPFASSSTCWRNLANFMRTLAIPETAEPW